MWFSFADVVVGHAQVGEHGPERRDAILPHVEDAGAERRREPFVQRRAVVVAVEVGDPVLEVRERVRAVDHHGHAARVRHVADRTNTGST